MSELETLLSQHYFQGLFIEHLGWDHVSGSLTVTTDGQSFGFEAIAEKRGFQVLHCVTDRLTIIDRGLLRRIQKRVAALAHEHILIYSSNAPPRPPRQVWQWAIRCDDGRKLRHREHPFFSESPPRPLLDRLAGLEFRFEEEEKCA